MAATDMGSYGPGHQPNSGLLPAAVVERTLAEPAHGDRRGLATGRRNLRRRITVCSVALGGLTSPRIAGAAAPGRIARARAV